MKIFISFVQDLTNKTNGDRLDLFEEILLNFARILLNMLKENY